MNMGVSRLCISACSAERTNAEMGAMKMRRTCLKDYACRVNRATVSRTGLSPTGGTPRKIWQEICPTARFFAMTLIGLCFGAGIAAARETGATSAQAKATPSGIRNPLNPEAYMQELASRLNTSKEKNALLRGVTTPSVPSTSLRATTARPLTPTLAPTAPAPESREALMRRLIAEELDRQVEAEQQAAAEQEALRRQIAAAEEQRRREQIAAEEEQKLREQIAAELSAYKQLMGQS
jgi:hypothetical protein